MLNERYLKILDDMTMVRIYVKTSTSTINVANHRAKGGWNEINFQVLSKNKRRGGGIYAKGRGVYTLRGGGGGGGVYTLRGEGYTLAT